MANASNAGKIRDWLRQHAAGFKAELADRQTSTCMLAVQGPQALERLADGARPGVRAVAEAARLRRDGLAGSRRVRLAHRLHGRGRPGARGVRRRPGPPLWRALLDAGVRPCGLGARDTLRLEAALLLYGNDMDETVNPFEVGLGWAVTLDDGADFIGREALLRARDGGAAPHARLPEGGGARRHAAGLRHLAFGASDR